MNPWLQQHDDQLTESFFREVAAYMPHNPPAWLIDAVAEYMAVMDGKRLRNHYETMLSDVKGFIDETLTRAEAFDGICLVRREHAEKYKDPIRCAQCFVYCGTLGDSIRFWAMGPVNAAPYERAKHQIKVESINVTLRHGS